MKKLFAAIVALTMAFTLAACEEGLEEEFVDITLESDVEEADLTQEPEEVAEGMEVTVTASDVDGYDFVQWTDVDTDEEVSTDREYTFTAEDAVTLEAVYEDTGGSGSGGDDDDITVDLSSDVSGASLTASEEGPYESGDEITIEASEVDTYTFQHWLDTESDTVLSEDMSYTFTVDEDMSVEAVYEDTLEEDERAAQTVVDESTADMTYLDTVMEDYDIDEGMTMTMHMALEMEDPDSSDTLVYDMNVEVGTAMEDGNRISKLSMTMDNPEMEDTLAMTMIMEEGADSTTYTMNTEMLLNMIEEDFEESEGEPLDMKSLLDMDSPYVHLTVPNDLEGSDQEAVFNQIMDEIYTEMYGEDYDESDIPEYNQDTIDTVTENLMDMQSMLNFSQLSSYEGVELEMTRDGNVAKGTLSMGGNALRPFAEDFLEEIYTTAEVLDENDELPSYTEFTENAQYTNMMTIIGSMPDIDINMEYDAGNGSMNIDVAVMTLYNFLTQTSDELSGVDDITMEMTMEQGANIDDEVSDSKNIEPIAEEVIQIATLVNSAEYMGTVAADTNVSAGTHTLAEIESQAHYIDLPFIDKDLSELTIEDTADGRVPTLELYYAHNEAAVFENTTLTMSEMEALMPTDEAPVRDDIVAMTDLFNDTNFELYPVLGAVLEQSFEETTEDPSNPMPTEDQVGDDVDESTLYDRYPGSVWIDHMAYEGVDQYTYATQDAAEDVNTYFETHLDEDNLTLLDQQSDDSSYTLIASDTATGETVTVVINKDSRYDSGIEYVITIGSSS